MNSIIWSIAIHLSAITVNRFHVDHHEGIRSQFTTSKRQISSCLSLSGLRGASFYCLCSFSDAGKSTNWGVWLVILCMLWTNLRTKGGSTVMAIWHIHTHVIGRNYHGNKFRIHPNIILRTVARERKIGLTKPSKSMTCMHSELVIDRSDLVHTRLRHLYHQCFNYYGD